MLVLVLGLVWVLQDGATPEISFSADPIVEGTPVTLTLKSGAVPLPGVSLTAKYRENADESLRSEQAIGTTDTQGQVEWTPEQAGVVVLTWKDGSHKVAVRHAGVPPLAVLIAVLAGLFLLGGSVVFFVHMLRDGGVAFEEEQPPST